MLEDTRPGAFKVPHPMISLDILITSLLDYGVWFISPADSSGCLLLESQTRTQFPKYHKQSANEPDFYWKKLKQRRNEVQMSDVICDWPLPLCPIPTEWIWRVTNAFRIIFFSSMKCEFWTQWNVYNTHSQILKYMIKIPVWFCLLTSFPW